jgi:spore coat polysaccharide biosynthesis protein SpsF
MLLAGKPLIWHVLNRVKKARYPVVLAIPVEPNSAPLVEAADSLNIPTIIVGGNPNDLAHRYAVAARCVGADIVVRVPGDNPCVDAIEIRNLLDRYWTDRPRWNWLMSNLDRDILDNGYPGGVGAEIYDAGYFRFLDHHVYDPTFREHPHRWCIESDRVVTCLCPEDIRRPDLRFDVNTQEDFDFIAGIYDALYPMNPNFQTRDILAYLEGKNDVESTRSKSADLRCGEHNGSGDHGSREDHEDPLERAHDG